MLYASAGEFCAFVFLKIMLIVFVEVCVFYMNPVVCVQTFDSASVCYTAELKSVHTKHDDNC